MLQRVNGCPSFSGRVLAVATLKTELVYRIVLVTKARARQRLIRWFDRYNQTRRHSRCGWRAPITYEKINTNTARAA